MLYFLLNQLCCLRFMLDPVQITMPTGVYKTFVGMGFVFCYHEEYWSPYEMSVSLRLFVVIHLTVRGLAGRYFEL